MRRMLIFLRKNLTKGWLGHSAAVPQISAALGHRCAMPQPPGAMRWRFDRAVLLPLTIALIGLLALEETARAESSVEVQHCLVSLIAEAQVPAEEPGVLVDVKVREGQQVAAGELLAQIDDALMVMQQDINRYKLNVAEAQAKNNVDVDYAKAAAAHAKASLDRQIDANQKFPQSVTQQAVDEYRLGWKKAILQIEQASVNKHIAGLQADVSKAELQAAAENIDRRKIKAPLDGVVVKVNRHAGEWVAAGDQVMHLVGIDRLRIKGSLSAGDYLPSQVAGRPVTVTVALAGGRQETFEGRIVFVSPSVGGDNDFEVWAEVNNRQEAGFWLLRPGLWCTMTIHLP